MFPLDGRSYNGENNEQRTRRLTMTAQKEKAYDTSFDDFIAFPIHKLVSVFESPQDADAAVEELKANGFSEDDIEAVCGLEGERRMDLAGTKHGFAGMVLRNFQHIGPDRTYLERYEKHLRDGHCIVIVNVKSKLRKERAARILHHHTDERVTYFGTLSTTEIR